jgi:hypothetical protein
MFFRNRDLVNELPRRKQRGINKENILNIAASGGEYNPERLKGQLNLAGCQAGYTRSTEETTDSQPQPQTHHIALCLVTYLVVERERFERGMTWRQFKRHLIPKKPHTPLPALERLRMAA